MNPFESLSEFLQPIATTLEVEECPPAAAGGGPVSGAHFMEWVYCGQALDLTPALGGPCGYLGCTSRRKTGAKDMIVPRHLGTGAARRTAGGSNSNEKG